MSDQEFAKKEVESMELEYFLYEYERVTGEQFVEVARTERPDFVCARPSGALVGVELTKIMRPYDGPYERRARAAVAQGDYLDAWDAFALMHGACDYKNAKRRQGNWLLPQSTILVLQLVETPIDELEAFADGAPREDFDGFGFAEIWAADYSEIEIWGDTPLFGLSPQRWWGRHTDGRLSGKPYG